MCRSAREELTRLTHTVARRTARLLERQGLLERDAEQAYFTAEAVDEDPMASLLGPAITYRVAVGPHQGRKVMAVQTLPPDDPFEPSAGLEVRSVCELASKKAVPRAVARAGQVAGFSLHAGVAAKAGQRDKLERLCRYVSRPPVAERRLSLTTQGKVSYRLKTPYRNGTRRSSRNEVFLRFAQTDPAA